MEERIKGSAAFPLVVFELLSMRETNHYVVRTVKPPLRKLTLQEIEVSNEKPATIFQPF